MGVDLGEVQFAGQEEDRGADHGKALVPPGSDLKEAIQRFQKPVGGPGLGPGGDPLPSKCWGCSKFLGIH